LLVFHERWGINAKLHHKRAIERWGTFENSLPPEVWKAARTVHMGYKQCQKVDDAAVAKAAIAVAAVVCSGYTGNPTACSEAASIVNGIV
jgi:hypothetical protein